MLPSQFDPSTASAAERKLFELLQHDPDTNDWVVLHSLGLSRRGRKPYGEIDFVVFVPGRGVLCLEVKGGRVACLNGRWETTNWAGKTDVLNRSPFLQAREGMFALRDSVLNRAPQGFPSGLLYAYAVVMPDVTFSEQSPEWESWQIIDRDALKQPISKSLLRLASGQQKLHPGAHVGEPSPATMRILQQLLRPDFELVVTRGTQIEDTETQLLRLTEEQFHALDLLSGNDRCLFEGPAGTGKTMLALEYARRTAAAGKRTLVICYNRLLGDWLEHRAAESDQPQNLTAGSFFKRLREIIVSSSVAGDFLEQESRGQTEELFDSVYPLCGVLAVEERKQLYDVLVMDEAQDLLRPGILDVLNSWLNGGLVGGRWAIFGDFQRQAIFSPTTGEDLKTLLESTAGRYTRCRLTMNCRNTRNIGEETALLSGFASPPYRMGQVVGPPVDYHYYDSDRKQRDAFADTVRRLLAGGVSAADIIVISRLRLANSGIAGVDGGNSFRLAEVGEHAASGSRVPVIRFSTAQAFKGMESAVVVLCDVEQVSDQEPQALLYVAMSRARSLLTMLVHVKAQPLIAECVRRKLLESWRKSP